MNRCRNWSIEPIDSKKLRRPSHPLKLAHRALDHASAHAQKHSAAGIRLVPRSRRLLPRIADLATLSPVSLAIPMRFADVPLLTTIDDIYTLHECERFIHEIERAAPTLATNNPIYRDQDRLIIDDPERAADLFQRLHAYLPPQMGALELDSINERLRMYRYRPGQRFAPHMDHWHRPDQHRITLLTVLVYFNGDFHGGETRFIEPSEQVIVPQPGRVALFQHNVRHEGCPVFQGTKYAMRSDVIYRATQPIGECGDSILVDSTP